MENRNMALMALRPKIPTIINDQESSLAEKFQNKTLRPILKFQNDLLVVVFKQYINKRKGVYYGLSEKQKNQYIQDHCQKDSGLKNLLLGLILGHFSMEEWAIFSYNEKENTRRISTLLIQRLQSQFEDL